MAKFLNNWILALGLVVLICVGCKQSNSKSDSKTVEQMTVAELKATADKGNPQAQFELGERFNNGNGVLKDSTEAVEWWQKAAAQKFPPAEFNLGIAYGRGDGVPKDKQEGIKWVRMAADSGLAQAQEVLGVFYCIGHGGVTQDYSKALLWFNAAAAQDYSPAQYYLALCLRDGKGTLPDKADAVLWLQRAASNGVANAQFMLGRYYFNAGFTELGIPNQIKPDAFYEKPSTNQDFVRAVEWLRKAANQNYLNAQVYLGIAYATGAGTDKNPIESYKWFALASAKDSHLVETFLKGWNTNKPPYFTPEQISEGEHRAKEFSKTNHITPKSVPEIPGL